MRFRLLSLLVLAGYLPMGTGAAGAWHVWFDHHHESSHHDHPPTEHSPTGEDSAECATCFHLLTVAKWAFEAPAVVHLHAVVFGHLIAAPVDSPVIAACPIPNAPRAPPSIS